jgi:hypothetical protein
MGGDKSPHPKYSGSSLPASIPAPPLLGISLGFSSLSQYQRFLGSTVFLRISPFDLKNGLTVWNKLFT